ncbi:MAG: PAS domain S-box protein [Burkholderiales bacterium]
MLKLHHHGFALPSTAGLRATLPWIMLFVSLACTLVAWHLLRTGAPTVGKPAYTLAGGIVISALMFLVGWFSASTRRRAEELAREMAQAQHRSEAQLHGVIDTARDAIISIDESHRIVLFNPAAERIFGWPREQMMGVPLHRLIPERFRERHEAHVSHFGTTGETARAMGSDLPLYGLRANGEEFPIDASISRLTDGSHFRYTVILRDITRRKQAEDALKLSLRFSEEVMQSVNEGIIVYDRDLRVVSWNRFMEELTGLAKTSAVGKQLYELFPALRALDVEDYFRRALGGQVVVSDHPLPRLRGTTEYLTSAQAGSSEDPRLAWTLSYFAPHLDHLGNIVGVIVTVVDVTEITRNRMQLNRTNEHLRQLSAHLETVRESERTRIAREIHDDLAGTLSGIKMDISAARNLAAQDPEALAKRLDASLALIDGAVQATRRIINDLRPSILDTLGVWAAIEWQAHETAKRAGMACEVEVSADAECTNLSSANATALFRIVQESLNNVWRHSGASRVAVRASRDNGMIRVQISDDGKGFDEAGIQQSGHWGIMGMYERVRSHGGELHFASSPGNGTQVSVSLPVG